MNIYVEPAIEIRRKRTIDRIRIKDEPYLAYSPYEPARQEEYFFESISMDRIVQDDSDYVVVGESGIGKTSFLRWIGYQISSGKFASDFIPIFVNLKDISHINTQDAFIPLLDTQYHLKDYDLAGKGILFLLDGLDQITDFGNIVKRLENKDIFGKEKRIILTTRPIGYEWVKNKFKHEYLCILPFDEKRIKEYIGENYENAQFQVILNQNKELLSIPILLRMIRILLEKDRLSDIKSRADLYQEFISYLFEKWEREKKGNLPAYTTSVRIQEDLSFLSYQAIANKYLGSFSLEMGLKYLGKERIDELIFWSVTHNLVEKGGEEIIVYTHQSFQEYLASAELKNRLFKDNHLDEDALLEHLEYRYWDETFKFLAGRKDLDEEKVAELINTIKKYDLFLTSLCLPILHCLMNYD